MAFKSHKDCMIWYRCALVDFFETARQEPALGEEKQQLIAFLEDETLVKIDNALLGASDPDRDSDVILDDLIDRFPNVNAALAKD